MSVGRNKIILHVVQIENGIKQNMQMQTNRDVKLIVLSSIEELRILHWKKTVKVDGSG